MMEDVGVEQESGNQNNEKIAQPLNLDENSEGAGDIEPPSGQQQDEAASLKDSADKLQQEVEAVKQELSQMKDRYMRSVAEMENLRKRMDKEKNDLLRYGQEKLIQDLLPVLDSFDKALAATEGSAAAPSSTENVAEGIKLVFKQLSAALERHGLKVVEALDKPFDPNLHQALMRQEKHDIREDTVVQEYTRGYLLHDRLIRPAMVVVATPKD
jgi:molecular chaperone GrpE